MAHGKPIILNEKKEFVTTRGELEKKVLFKADWEEFITPEFFNQAYDDTEEIWQKLRGASCIKISKTISNGRYTATVTE